MCKKKKCYFEKQFFKNVPTVGGGTPHPSLPRFAPPPPPLKNLGYAIATLNELITEFVEANGRSWKTARANPRLLFSSLFPWCGFVIWFDICQTSVHYGCLSKYDMKIFRSELPIKPTKEKFWNKQGTSLSSFRALKTLRRDAAHARD